MTIIEYAIKYAETIQNKIQTIYKINKVRLSKRLFLPFEMFGIDGDQTNNAYHNNEEVSAIEWTFLKDKVARNVIAGENDI